MIKNLLWVCLALAALAPVSLPLFNQLDGRLYPVVGPIKIEEILKVEDGWTYFSMSAKKLRECRWRETKFYLGTRNGNNVPAPFQHLGKPNLKGVGEHFWPSSRVQLTPKQLLTESYIDLWHDCGSLLGLTVTPLPQPSPPDEGKQP
jgi:hypothetical protein